MIFKDVIEQVFYIKIRCLRADLHMAILKIYRDKCVYEVKLIKIRNLVQLDVVQLLFSCDEQTDRSIADKREFVYLVTMVL